jgi:hypothetical protein
VSPQRLSLRDGGDEKGREKEARDEEEREEREREGGREREKR